MNPRRRRISRLRRKLREWQARVLLAHELLLLGCLDLEDFRDIEDAARAQGIRWR